MIMKFSVLPIIVLFGCYTTSNGMDIHKVTDERGHEWFEFKSNWPGEKGGKFEHDPRRGQLLVIAVMQEDTNLVQEILQGISDEKIDEKLNEIIKNFFDGRIDALCYFFNIAVPGAQRPYEGTALLCASRGGAVDIIEKLLAFGVNINKPIDNYHQTPLTLAAQYRQTKTLQYLIQMNADLTAQTSDGTTALMEAVRLRGVPFLMMKMLIHPDTALIDEIDNRRSMSKQYCNSTEALELAAQEWESCPLDVLHSCVQPFIPFIDNGINLQDKSGMTALMWAVQCSNYKAVAYLLKNDADTSITDKSGKTAADYYNDPRK
jgi:hypothetical protein